MKKVVYITGSRADYGIVRRYLSLLAADANISFSIIVTGAHLDNKYGKTEQIIREDGFRIEKEVVVKLDNSSDKGVISSMAEILTSFGSYFADNKFDLAIILGDRYEMFSVATAAAMNKIPILHLHGGELTYANYDEFIRHCITKMSMYHFASTEEYRNRIIQMGESPDRVFNVGALGAENCQFINENNVDDGIKYLSKEDFFLVAFHPETLSETSSASQADILLDAIDSFPNYRFVFMGTNADTGADSIRNKIYTYVEKHANALYIENLNSDSYLYLLKNAIALIGNSSSGIIEAPSLKTMTINIGDRQKGRVRGESVIDVSCQRGQIVDAINRALNSEISSFINPYETHDTAKKCYEITLNLLKRENGTIKEFYDL